MTDESIVLSADFEEGMAGWVSSAGIAPAGDENQALLLAVGQSISPEADPALSNFSISGDVLFTGDDNSGMSLVSGAYTLNLSSAGATLSIDGQVFGTDETALATNIWHTFSVSVVAGELSVTVNDAELFSFSSEAVADSNILLSANDAMMLDNLVLRDESSVDTLATDAPGDDVSPDASMKMSGSLFMIAEALQSGDLANAQTTIENARVDTDESGRVLVELRAAPGFDSSDLVALVENIGADVSQVNERDIEVYVPAEALLALAGTDVIEVMLQPSRAVPTGPTAGSSSDVFNPTFYSAFDSLGAQTWHTATAPVTGTGITIGIVDSDFGTALPAATGEYICLASNPLTPPGAPGGTASAHGLNAVEVICDIAPDSDVYLYKANDYTSMGDAITAATADNMDIILVTLDLGADTTRGDGVGVGGASDPYSAIQSARAAGIPVIAAAGNNNLRYVSYQAGGATTATIEFSIPEGNGGTLKVGWSTEGSTSVGTVIAHQGGGGAGNIGATSSGYSLNITSPCTAPQVDGNGRCNYTATVSTSGGGIIQVQLVPDTDGDIDLILQDTDTIPNSGDEYATGAGVDDLTWRTGNLARPADSPHAIAVGAVCNDYTSNYAILEHSSKGPKFATGGNEPTVLTPPLIRSQVKPDIVSVSQVSTSRTTATSCDTGYGGSSAAAANVAGVVALLQSNTTNASMTGATTTAFTADSAVAVDNLLDYLQTRTTDMPFGAAADGYDYQYGAGLAMLGSPYYDLSKSANTTTLPDPDAETGELGNECAAGIVYVGQGNPGGGAQPNGSKALPFQSIGQALNSIIADNTCVIVMPGEYAGGVHVNGVTNAGVIVKSYDDVTVADRDESIFWLVNGFYRVADSVGDTYGSAGLFFENGAVGVTFSGFNFIPVEPYVQSADSAADELRNPGGVMFYNSESSVIRDSSFGEITLDSITYPGWNNTRAIPVRVLDGSDGARVFRNTMINNSTSAGTDGSAVEVLNAGTNSSDLTRVRIDENTIKGHSNTRSSLDIQNWSAIIWTDDSAVDIVNNKFIENTAETIVQVRTVSETDTKEQRIMGNIFLNNQVTTDDPPGASAGPLINAYHARNLFILSNSFIKNVMDTGSIYGGLVVRGDTKALTGEGSNVGDSNTQ
ncbi:MAG: S8 family serine peptidase, partial [Aggregatilineales bacterium]